MNAFISIFMCLVISNGCFSVNFNCDNRPSWKNGIDQDFKAQCIQYAQLPNNCAGAHLAHGLSWSGICETVDALFFHKDFESIQAIVELLFEVDS